MCPQRDTEAATGAACGKRRMCWGGALGNFSKNNGESRGGGGAGGEGGGMTKDKKEGRRLGKVWEG